MKKITLVRKCRWIVKLFNEINFISITRNRLSRIIIWFHASKPMRYITQWPISDSLIQSLETHLYWALPARETMFAPNWYSMAHLKKLFSIDSIKELISSDGRIKVQFGFLVRPSPSPVTCTTFPALESYAVLVANSLNGFPAIKSKSGPAVQRLSECPKWFMCFLNTRDTGTGHWRDKQLCSALLWSV